MNSVFIKLTRNKNRHKYSDELNFGHIWPVILELVPLSGEKKWCHQLFSVTFDWIFGKLAGNEDRHKSSNEFKFGLDRIIHFEFIRPWVLKLFPIDL